MHAADGFGQEERYVDELLAAFAGRVDHPREFALANRVLLLRGSSNVPLDISLGAMPFEERCIGPPPSLSATPSR